MNVNTARDAHPEATEIRRTMLDQIGRMTVLAICGGRLQATGLYTIEFKDSSAGHIVEVTYDSVPDAYTVRRLFRRGGKTWIKGEMDHVYADQLSDACYTASCWNGTPFGNDYPLV